jgi:hypothetical protein
MTSSLDAQGSAFSRFFSGLRSGLFGLGESTNGRGRKSSFRPFKWHVHEPPSPPLCSTLCSFCCRACGAATP